MNTTVAGLDGLRVQGHAFRKVKGGYSAYRGFVPTCECGYRPFDYATNLRHARQLHAAHKRAVLREAVSA